MVLTRRQSAAASTSSSVALETIASPSSSLHGVTTKRQSRSNSEIQQLHTDNIPLVSSKNNHSDKEIPNVPSSSSSTQPHSKQTPEPKPPESTINKTTTTNTTKTTKSKENDIEISKPKKKSGGGDFLKRLLSGLLLTVLYFAVIRGGHMWVGLAVVLMEVGMFNEVLRLGFTVARGGRIPLWRTTGWYFFWSLQFLLYGKIVLSHFHDQNLAISKLSSFQYALEHHSFISFCMYCAGLVGFVLSLRPDKYHFQFTYFGRALVALLLVVIQSHFMILNTHLGLVWFVLPCWLIVVNDSFGYFCGRLFGKHSLTALSPKKTWEGYIGAGIFTMITAYFLSDVLSNYSSLICPRDNFDDCYFTCPPLSCHPLPEPFIKKMAYLGTIPYLGFRIEFLYRPVQLHAVALGAFAASIAPFGGFFASGAKRAFGVKDFGGLLPGHGGVTDRVDCQLMMAVFTYVYVINFVKVNFVGSPDVGKVLSFVNELTTPEQIDLLTELYIRLKKTWCGWSTCQPHECDIISLKKTRLKHTSLPGLIEDYVKYTLL